MENIITGYQYGDDFSFIGTYQFDNNLDQDAIHLPPRTTLTAPPTGLAAGQEAAFNEETKEWFVRDEDLSWMDEESRTKYLASLAA